MEEGARRLHAQLEQAQPAVESMPKESFEDRMARQRAYLDAVHTTAQEMGLDWSLARTLLSTEDKLLAEIAHYDRVIEEAEAATREQAEQE